MPVLAPLERFVHARPRAIVIASAVLALVSLALLTRLEFDFNTLNLRSAKVESVATVLDLAKNPETTPFTADVLAANLAAADAIAKKLSALREVAQALTLSSFIPEDQETKLAMISDASLLLGPALVPSSAVAPSDAENVRAMTDGARRQGVNSRLTVC